MILSDHRACKEVSAVVLGGAGGKVWTTDHPQPPLSPAARLEEDRMNHKMLTHCGQVFRTTIEYGNEEYHVECIIIPPVKGFSTHIDSPAYLDPGKSVELKDMHVYRQWGWGDEEVTQFSPRSLSIIEGKAKEAWKLDQTAERMLEVTA
jgi:hypothetical protein